MKIDTDNLAGYIVDDLLLDQGAWSEIGPGLYGPAIECDWSTMKAVVKETLDTALNNE